MTQFIIDTRLKNDSILIGNLQLCEVRLINDCRWPWLILVPMQMDVFEIHELTENDQQLLAAETAKVARTLQQMLDLEKINTGALGNVVRQLHIHVVARNVGDANWPGPIWGFGRAVPYPHQNADNFISQLREQLNVTLL